MAMTGTAENSGAAGMAAARAHRIAGLRRAMVDCQLRTYDVTDRAVLAAMDAVPREAFLPGHDAELAYLDREETVRSPEGGVRTLLAPMVLARMIQFLDVKPGQHVLDYAGAAGYSAAVLSAMGARVLAAEPAPGLSAMARRALDVTKHGDVVTVAELAGEHSGFDAILINGACEVQPDAILARLGRHGRAIAVIGQGRAAKVMLYQRSDDAIAGRMVFDAAAPMLDEFRKPAEFVF